MAARIRRQGPPSPAAARAATNASAGETCTDTPPAHATGTESNASAALFAVNDVADVAAHARARQALLAKGLRHSRQVNNLELDARLLAQDLCGVPDVAGPLADFFVSERFGRGRERRNLDGAVVRTLHALHTSGHSLLPLFTLLERPEFLALSPRSRAAALARLAEAPGTDAQELLAGTVRSLVSDGAAFGELTLERLFDADQKFEELAPGIRHFDLARWMDLGVAARAGWIEFTPKVRALLGRLPDSSTFTRSEHRRAQPLSAQGISDALLHEAPSLDGDEARLYLRILRAAGGSWRRAAARVVAEGKPELSDDARSVLRAYTFAQTLLRAPPRQGEHVTDVARSPHPRSWEELLSLCPHLQQVKPGEGGRETPVASLHEQHGPDPMALSRFDNGVARIPWDRGNGGEIKLDDIQAATRIRNAHAFIFTAATDLFLRSAREVTDWDARVEGMTFSRAEPAEPGWETVLLEKDGFSGLQNADGTPRLKSVHTLVDDEGSFGDILTPHAPIGDYGERWATALAKAGAALASVVNDLSADFEALERHYAPELSLSTFHGNIRSTFLEGLASYSGVMSLLTANAVRDEHGAVLPIESVAAGIETGHLLDKLAKLPNGMVGPLFNRGFVPTASLELKEGRFALHPNYQALLNESKAHRDENPKVLDFAETGKGCPIAIRGVPVLRDDGVYELTEQTGISEIGKRFIELALHFHSGEPA